MPSGIPFLERGNGMSTKQDKVYTRTASQLEQKYQFGKSFAEILGIVSEYREKVDSVESSVHSEIREQYTKLARDSEQIILSAFDECVKTSDYDKFKETLESELRIMAENITMNFTKTTEQYMEVDGELKSVSETLKKHFDFSVDGLVIKAGDGSMELHLDNDMIKFMKNGQQFGWWDGVNFHTGNIKIDTEEQITMGNFAFIPEADGSLSFLKVGDT